jgi:hypothetical protein
VDDSDCRHLKVQKAVVTSFIVGNVTNPKESLKVPKVSLVNGYYYLCDAPIILEFLGEHRFSEGNNYFPGLTPGFSISKIIFLAPGLNQ